MGANKNSNFQKCGNILIDIKTIKSQEKNYAIICGFCSAEYDKINFFSRHLEEKHLHDFAIELDQATAEPETSSSSIVQQETIKMEKQTDADNVRNEKLGSPFTLSEVHHNPSHSGPICDTANTEEIDVPPIKREHGEAFDEDDEYWDPQYNKRFHINLMSYSDEDMDTFQKSNDHTNEKDYLLDDETSGNSKNVDEELSSRQMPNDHAQTFKGNKKFFPQQVKPSCHDCEELSYKFDLYKDASQKQYKNLVDILAEHKVLLERIANQNSVAPNMMSYFPINSEEKLKEFDSILATQAELYKRQIKSLLGGNAERNLHQIFGNEIIMNFNIDGTFGKKRLRNFANVFAVMIDVISTFSESADKTLRAAFQRQKKKYFKQTSRNKVKNQDQSKNESDSSDKE